MLKFIFFLLLVYSAVETLKDWCRAQACGCEPDEVEDWEMERENYDHLFKEKI